MREKKQTRDSRPVVQQARYGRLGVAIALWALTATIVVVDRAHAQDAAVAVSVDALGLEVFRLWPTRAPQSNSDDVNEIPTITVFRPHPGTENGTAVIVAPGGGYIMLATTLEGRLVADWLASRGITAFLLKYRVGPSARLPVPLFDGVRAVRYVRANAARFKIDPHRIGMMGFSAGGHLTASTAASGDSGNSQSPDPVERVSSKVDFAILAYPWLEGMVLSSNGRSQYCTFQGADCDPHLYVQYHPIDKVSAKFPPTFLYHTTADSLVSADSIVKFYQALLANNVPVEMHIFARGAHGTGLGGSDPALGLWPKLLEEWLRNQGLLTSKSLLEKRSD